MFPSLCRIFPTLYALFCQFLGIFHIQNPFSKFLPSPLSWSVSPVIFFKCFSPHIKVFEPFWVEFSVEQEKWIQFHCSMYRNTVFPAPFLKELTFVYVWFYSILKKEETVALCAYFFTLWHIRLIYKPRQFLSVTIARQYSLKLLFW